MRRVSYTLFSAQSLAANFTSDAIDLRQVERGSIQITTANMTDNTGQFSLLGSNDGSNYVAITLDTAIAALANTNVTKLINLADLGFDYAKLDFVASGSTPNGTATATVVKKSDA